MFAVETIIEDSLYAFKYEGNERNEFSRLFRIIDIMANIDKLNSLATSDSNWLGEAKNRQKNKEWLKHSQKIAIKILRTLREKSIKQKELAAMINVSPQQINKIVKGKENLTLETISKLEKALETKLIFSKNENQTIT